MSNNYKIAYEYLSAVAKDNNLGELEFPPEERACYYINGNGFNTIDSVIFDFGFFESDFIQDSESQKRFLNCLQSIEIYPEHSENIDKSEGLLHIRVTTSEY